MQGQRTQPVSFSLLVPSFEKGSTSIFQRSFHFPVDRVHRLGQSRSVRVYRFGFANSLEERFWTIQQHEVATTKGFMMT